MFEKLQKNQTLEYHAKNPDDNDQRRLHIYRGLDPDEYHKYFDEIYNFHVDELDSKEHQGGNCVHEHYDDHKDKDVDSDILLS